MSQTISVTFISAGNFTWQALDNAGVVANGTGTSVQNAGAQALTALKIYLQNQATNFTSLNTNWQ